MNFLLGQKNLDHWSAKKRGKKLIKLLLIAISKKKFKQLLTTLQSIDVVGFELIDSLTNLVFCVSIEKKK